jgi:hypothetical protein
MATSKVENFIGFDFLGGNALPEYLKLFLSANLGKFMIS